MPLKTQVDDCPHPKPVFRLNWSWTTLTICRYKLANCWRHPTAVFHKLDLRNDDIILQNRTTGCADRTPPGWVCVDVCSTTVLTLTTHTGRKIQTWRQQVHHYRTTNVWQTHTSSASVYYHSDSIIIRYFIKLFITCRKRYSGQTASRPGIELGSPACKRSWYSALLLNRLRAKVTQCSL